MTSSQTFKVNQIKGFVNSTLKSIKNLHNTQLSEDTARYLIQAVFEQETDKEVIKECEKSFKEWYNY